MFKKGFTLVELLAVIVILAVIALIATPIVKKSIANSKNQALKETINSIERAAYNYGYQNDIGYDTNYKKLTLDELISKGFLKGDIINPVTNEKMNGCVLYRWNETNNQYEFKYNEECPKYPESLITVLLEQYNESNTTGLVKDSTNENLYYYTGTKEDVANNFLWYGGHQWRVLEFDTSANTLTLVTQQPLTAIQPASVAWTTQEAYESSYINTWLNDYFWNSLDSSIQSNILDSIFNVGIYTDVDEITTTQKVGLLDEEQYKRTGDGTTGKDSFLDIKDWWWLGNRYSSSYYVRYVHFDGTLGNSYGVNYRFGVRAVIKISDLTITKGDGTLVNSYQVVNNATNTNEVQVGEYLSVPYNGSDNACGSDNMCTFRVVSKNSNSIKVVLNGLLPTASAWADNASDNITTSDLIYTSLLNGFINNIDSKYITTGIYGVGMYASGNDYTVPQSTTITTNVGLPTVGEMFSGNDIDLGSSSKKIFVDVNTIENPTAESLYWTMNRCSSSSACGVENIGELRNYSVSSSSKYGVRPVIYLKSGTSAITFTGGEGTPNSPYILQ